MQGNPEAFGIGWKGGSWQLWRLGRRRWLELRCGARALELSGGAQVFEMQVCTGLGAELQVATVSLFCSIVSTLRLPRPPVVQHTLRNNPKLFHSSEVHVVICTSPALSFIFCIFTSVAAFSSSLHLFLNIHHFLCPLLCRFCFPSLSTERLYTRGSMCFYNVLLISPVGSNMHRI